jgi:uncharacterized membrane protein YphA (DoxX/SURF4 family)
LGSAPLGFAAGSVEAGFLGAAPETDAGFGGAGFPPAPVAGAVALPPAFGGAGVALGAFPVPAAAMGECGISSLFSRYLLRTRKE